MAAHLLPGLELHPEYRNARYTLRGLFTDEAVAAERAQQLVSSGLDVYEYREGAPSGTVVYGVAARHNLDPVVRTGIPHVHSVDWEATRAAVDLFRRIMRASKGKRAFRWYKKLDVELLHRRIQGLDWNGSHLDVASGIASDLILTHPFPNANHRTSLHLARSYLQACGIPWPHYSLRGRGADRLHRDTKPFFLQSKYLLQLYRHPEMIQTAHSVGYTRLTIGPEAEATIDPEDLELSKQKIEARHRAAARNLIRDLARGEALELLDALRSKRLREWIQTVQG